MILRDMLLHSDGCVAEALLMFQNFSLCLLPNHHKLNCHSVSLIDWDMI